MNVVSSEKFAKNRTPAHITGEKTILFDSASSHLKTKPDSSKKDVICFLENWTRAFSVFAMYRTALNPDLAPPLMKYLDHFCMLAEPKQYYTFPQLINYDKYFRAHAA